MAVKVYVAYTSFWKNFCTVRNEQAVIRDINEMLAEYNGRDVPISPYVDFDTEADATAFILKWS